MDYLDRARSPDSRGRALESGSRFHPNRASASFLTVGAGSVWTLNQGDGTISRVDMKTNRLVATIAAGIPGTGGEIAFGEGSVWATVFEVPMTRIDPASNAVAQQWVGPGGDSIRLGHGIHLAHRLRPCPSLAAEPQTAIVTPSLRKCHWG